MAKDTSILNDFITAAQQLKQAARADRQEERQAWRRYGAIDGLPEDDAIEAQHNAALVLRSKVKRRLVDGGKRGDVLPGEHVCSELGERHAHVWQVVRGPDDPRRVLVVAHERVWLHLVTCVTTRHGIELLEHPNQSFAAGQGFFV